MLRKVLIIAVLMFFPMLMHAEGMTLSIAPPMIKNNVNPGQIWKSSIKVVNNNAEDVEVYTQVLDFKSGDNGGTVEFLPAPNDKEKEDKVRLSSWIVMEDEKVIIPAFKSVDVPFVIDVPKSAEPGGHYAAILIGTKPPRDKLDGSVVKISSMLSSLILLSVSGDIKEDGRIREFSTNKDFYFEPKVDFKVKFENLGNVHIQPQGEIRVYDFFGKTKEVITLNHQSEFGNVLPGNTRTWDFSWQGSGSLTEMGRYKAQLLLSYGSKERETIDQTVYFWVIYLKPLLIIGGSLLFLFLLIVFSIKSYIKRSIRSVQLANGIVPKNERINRVVTEKMIEKRPVATLANRSSFAKAAADEKKVVNLRASSQTAMERSDEVMKNVKRSGFKKFVIFILVFLFVAAGFVYWYYFGKSGQGVDYNKLYQDNKAAEQVRQTEPSIEVASSSETDKTDEVAGEDMATSSEGSIATSSAENASSGNEMLTSEATSSEEIQEIDEIIPKANGELLIKVLNGGGVAGMANKVVELIGQKKYEAAQVGNADNYNYETTLIRYKKGDVKYAEEIKSLIDRKAIVEAVDGQEEDVVVIIGKSFVPTN
ncbi:LytR C-terminal domain-containing protein [Candidatus Parcubacteria bacterium]|nr:LytR C-terminal domain-containing protein [Patescibacteria group bacterium]MBU4309417.1 LytR C-terminal domain-containing protein [Patescibacteria group bacterium]MBU4432658.1 LytR C-terminal domain-containing protein [Patescibacteria group bacterium]MBU4577778.1 LytR C-terminal domain-containing protein [Patescibacteria group bacterium]MCG2697463.1 LytR C-terminal domain-containing protein [Candidatus Parcubacteria bacterium]